MVETRREWLGRVGGCFVAGFLVAAGLHACGGASDGAQGAPAVVTATTERVGRPVDPSGPCVRLLADLEEAYRVAPIPPRGRPVIGGDLLTAFSAAADGGCRLGDLTDVQVEFAQRVYAAWDAHDATTTTSTTTTPGSVPPEPAADDGRRRPRPAPVESSCRADGAPIVASGRLTDPIDGDSFEIDGLEVRLSIVDTPEWDHPGGSEATRFTDTWFGTAIVDVYRPEGAPAKDRYGRTLGDVVRRHDCSHLAVELVRAGHGEPMDAYCPQDRWLADQVGC